MFWIIPQKDLIPAKNIFIIFLAACRTQSKVFVWFYFEGAKGSRVTVLEAIRKNFKAWPFLRLVPRHGQMT
jgi:hypothetical protein